MSFFINSCSSTASNILYFAGGFLAAKALRQLVAYLRKRRIDQARCEVIVFPDKEIPCKDFFDSVEGCRRSQCSFSHEVTGFRKLIDCIKSARKSIDICVYCISCFEIVDYVLQRHKVGVRVRVITDLTMDDAAGSQNHRFMKHGIKVQTNKPPFLMHHKFMIIDDQLVCTGSFNWTIQAVTGNNESVIVTTDCRVVKPFCHEFQKLWLSTTPEPLVLARNQKSFNKQVQV